VAEHLVVALASVPFQIALGVFNTRRHALTRGEVRFWCVVVFVAAQLIYIGAFR
jgi:hypothetical protein